MASKHPVVDGAINTTLGATSSKGTKATFTLSEQSIAQVVELLGKCLEQQDQQNQVWQSQFQSVMAEQASLRYLLTCQHEQVLQRLPSSTSNASKSIYGGNIVSNDQTTISLDALHEVMPVQQQSESNHVVEPVEIVKETAETTTEQKCQETAETITEQKCEETTNPRQVVQKDAPPAFSLTTGKGVLIDISQLPPHWTVSSYGPQSTDPNENPIWHRAECFVRSGLFDVIFICVIFINLLTMVIQLQWRGYKIAYMMGRRPDDNNWDSARRFFEVLELTYTTLFAMEALLRIVFIGREFLSVTANVIDTVIVLVTCIQMYILQPVGLMRDASFVAVARLIRLVRVLRFLKVVRYAEALAELRILAKALSGCLGSLFWSMLLLIALTLAGAILLFQLVLAYVEDETNPEHLREWSYEHFGTITLSMLVLWETTFTGSWWRYSRPMILDMSVLYAIFWIPFVVCINFSVMRLIGALFLKSTMDVASIDAEKMTIARTKRQREFAESIREIFVEADSSGDGKIGSDEFQAMLYNERVGDCFEKLELEVYEVAVLFELLASDDGEANYHDFLEGALKLKQSAQTIDVIQLIHGNQKLGRSLDTVYRKLCEVASVVGIPVSGEGLDVRLTKGETRISTK